MSETWLGFCLPLIYICTPQSHLKENLSIACKHLLLVPKMPCCCGAAVSLYSHVGYIIHSSASGEGICAIRMKGKG